uniref:Ankyrin repeat and SOCS box containing 2a, tandem duplicate 1 n=1 Tax=Labrus bergylta TaxID=56723 RepID=A0A3Q3NC95_9LABR
MAAAASVSRSASGGRSFEDYSIYSTLSDDELLQLAIERSLTDLNDTTTTNDAIDATKTAPVLAASPPHPPDTANANANANNLHQCPHNPPPTVTPVHYSSPYPPSELPPDLELATQSETNLMLPSKPGWLAIHQAAWYGQETCLKVLLSAQPGMINKRTESGETALLVAVSKGRLNCVNMLLEYGADVDIANHEPETPLYKACERSSAAIVAALLNYGAAVNTRCILGWTALQEAVCRNNLEICDMLMKAGAKHNVKNTYGISPLFTAAQSGQLAALRFLLKHGADINSQAPDGATALYEAAKNGHEKVVELLVSQKADANKPGKTGLLPIHIAAQIGSVNIVRMLMGATSKARVWRTGISPLHLAAERNRDDVLEALIEAGYDVNAMLSEERSRLYEDRRSTALYFSVINNNVDAVRMLMGCIETLTLLVEHGADINASILTHPTTFPAVYMFSMKYLSLFKYLLDNGGHALSCFDCFYGNKPHPPIRTTRSQTQEMIYSDRGLPQPQGTRGVQFCEMISAPNISRWAGPIIDVLLDYVGNVTLCSKLMEHLDSYPDWSGIKEKNEIMKYVCKFLNQRVLYCKR